MMSSFRISVLGLLLAIHGFEVRALYAGSEEHSALRERPTITEFDIGEYIAAAQCNGVFVRSDQLHNPAAPTNYASVRSESAREEGSLVGVIAPPLSRFFARVRNQNKAVMHWPAQDHEGHYGFFLDFTPPLLEWPLRIPASKPFVAKSRVRVYNGAGFFLLRGFVTRRVWAAGMESVQGERALYEDCLRLHAETEMRLGPAIVIRLHEDLWLSRDFGLVRRIETIQGRLLWASIQSRHQFDRTEDLREPWMAAQKASVEPLAWSSMAIALDRGPPHIRVAGLLVEFASSSQSARLFAHTASK